MPRKRPSRTANFQGTTAGQSSGTPFPGSYPTNPPLCHSNVRAVPTGTVEEPQVTHSQKATVEDADEHWTKSRRKTRRLWRKTYLEHIPHSRQGGLFHHQAWSRQVLDTRTHSSTCCCEADSKRCGCSYGTCPKFQCEKGAERCCCRGILYNEPDFVNVKSLLEIACEARGFRAIFFPKFHCELNFIEQCWGYSKRVCCEFPVSSKEVDLELNA
ncbi:hypothetical protein K503DRAFT_869580, partial [Rhizopogon vinicolor AM-OR11-026]